MVHENRFIHICGLNFKNNQIYLKWCSFAVVVVVVVVVVCLFLFLCFFFIFFFRLIEIMVR